MGYPNRRYRVVDGKLEKVWTGTNDPGWFVNKADAWGAAAQSEINKRMSDRVPPPPSPEAAPVSFAAAINEPAETLIKTVEAGIDGGDDAVKPAPELVEQPEPSPPPPPPPPPPMPDATASDDDYETWKGPALRAEIKARTGKGPKVGAESTKVAMVERLRDIDAQRDGFEQKIGEAYAEVGEAGAVKVVAENSDGKPVVVPPAEIAE